MVKLSGNVRASSYNTTNERRSNAVEGKASPMCTRRPEESMYYLQTPAKRLGKATPQEAMVEAWEAEGGWARYEDFLAEAGEYCSKYLGQLRALVEAM